ncbi:MAG: Fe2+-dependent dioxygenase [Pseudomonadota bacterium]
MLEAIPDLLTGDQVASIRASIRDAGFVDGRKTAGARAARVKRNEQLGAGAPDKKAVQVQIVAALEGDERFCRFALPAKINRPLISRYRQGMEYGLHVDNALMDKGAIRSDLSVTVFLSGPEEYEGGELEIFSGYGPVKVKLPAGSVIVYPSSTLHRVLEVSDGERLAAVTWVQSRVRDPSRREILQDLDRARAKLSKDAPGAEETDRAHRAHANLLRMWAES